MIAECPACKGFFQTDDEEGGASSSQQLCPACMTALAEKMLTGQSTRVHMERREAPPAHV